MSIRLFLPLDAGARAVGARDVGAALAGLTERESAIAADRTRHGENAFHASGNLERAAQVMRRLWNEAATVDALPASLAKPA